MIDLRPRTLLRHRLRCICIAPLTIVLVAASLGVTWTVGPRKDRSVAFPCMDRACGCHDAASCRQHCCCFSDAEKVDWAAAHNVDASPFISESVVQELQDGQKACCRLTTKEISSARQHARTKKQTNESRTSGQTLSIAAFRRCLGLTQLWTMIAAALPPINSSQVDVQFVWCGMVVPYTPSPIFCDFSPPTPPPRFFVTSAGTLS